MPSNFDFYYWTEIKKIFQPLLENTKMQDINKEFKPSSWAINNKVAVFVLTLLLAIAGTNAYISLP